MENNTEGYFSELGLNNNPSSWCPGQKLSQLENHELFKVHLIFLKFSL